MRDRAADVIVVGLGAFGAATLYRLAKRGVRVLGIDRFDPPHVMGSTHGESRVTRLAVGEGATYAPFVRRSHALWREMEQETGRRLMLQTGCLVLSPHGEGPFHGAPRSFVQQTIAVAEEFGVEHEVLDAAAIEERFPQFILTGNEVGYYEPGAGMLFPEECVAAQLELARRAGARVQVDETVLAVEESAGGVTVRTSAGVYSAGEAVLAAGAWMPGLAGEVLARHAQVHRQTLHWFAPERPEDYAPERFPVFIWIHGKTEVESLYGLPMLPGSAGVKLGTEQFSDDITPDAVNRTVTPGESDWLFAQHVAGRLRGIGSEAAAALTCLYTVTPDMGFIVDHAPGHGHVHLISACSGHGFKHSAAMGEAIAARVLGGAGLDLSAFSLQRFQR